MNKYIVISIVIIISMLSISSTYAVNDNIEEKNNSLEVLWNQFVKTMNYIFNHDPLEYIEPDNENNDYDNTNVEDINNTTSHHIHEENTTISNEINDSHILDNIENSFGNSDKLLEQITE